MKNSSFAEQMAALNRRLDGYSSERKSSVPIEGLTERRIAQEIVRNDNIPKEMQDASLLKLGGNVHAFSMKVKSVDKYNKSVAETENSFAHPVGFTSKCLGKPSDCRGPPWTSSSNIYNDTEELEEDDDEDSEDGSRSSGGGGAVHIRSSEELLKHQAFSRTLINSANFHCPGTCSLGGNCMRRVSIVHIIEEMESIWGKVDKPSPSTSVRRRIIAKKLQSAFYRSLVPTDSITFVFTVAKDSGAKVCEASYLNIIGHPYSSLWKRIKRTIVQSITAGNDTLSDEKLEELLKTRKAPSEVRSKIKFENAQRFIEWWSNLHGSASPNEGEEDLRILPFETLSQLFHEYQTTCTTENADRNVVAQRETFRTAWVDLYRKKKCRFTRSKGTFPTCDICNNAADMLTSSRTSKYSQLERDIIISYLQCHLQQQAAERAALEGLKRLAKTSYDCSGNPTNAVFFGDFITKYAGHTPKLGKRISKNETSFFENRIFGVEIYCGPISGEVLIHTNELVRGGANLTVELQRRELADMLHGYGMSIPKEIHFQWDNCGENKNKYVFMYSALLVELGFFERVTVGFLIIGHTHASIDQYFSCLRKLIGRASFIASPLALHFLFSLDKSVSESTKSKMKSAYRPPLRQIQLLYIHDYKSAFAPYINEAIANYRIPYQFQFYMFAGKCICQYRQFSTSPEWLPILPSLELSGGADGYDELFKQRVYNFEDNIQLTSQDGLASFQEYIGIGSNVSPIELVSNKKIAATATALQNTLPILNEIEREAFTEQEQRHAYEQEGISDIPRFHIGRQADDAGNREPYADTIPSLQKSLQSLNTKQKGFLIWIDYLAQSPSPPSIANVVPTPINPKTIWDEKKNRGGQEELDRAERLAEKALEAYEDGLKIVEGNQDDDLSPQTDLSEVVGELSRALRVSKSEKRKKKIEKKSYNSRTDLQFVISALSNIKAAANFMLNKKIATGAISVSNKSFKELNYEKIFQRKVVTPEDLKYYEEHSTTESILKTVNDAIQRAPIFEWLPLRTLSEDQLLARERLLIQQNNQAAAIRRLCDQLLLREREKMQGETIERLTNQAQVRNEQRELARLDKEAQREQEREHKASLREQQAIERAAEKAEKAAERAAAKLEKAAERKAAKAAEKERMAVAKAQKEQQRLKSVTGKKRQRRASAMQLLAAASSDDDASNEIMECMEVESHVTQQRQHHSQQNSDAMSTSDDQLQNESTLKTFKDISSSLIQSLPQEDISAKNNPVDDTARPVVYGRRSCREDYSEENFKLASILNKGLKRACNTWSRLSDSKETSRHKRDGYAGLRISCQQAVLEDLNFPQYRTSYLSLLDLYNISIEAEHLRDMNDFSSSSSRLKFINTFISLLFDQMSTISDNSSSPLRTFIKRIHCLPDEY